MKVQNKIIRGLFKLISLTLLKCLNLSNQKKLKIVPNLLSNSSERISFIFIEAYIYKKSFKSYAQYNLNCEKQSLFTIFYITKNFNELADNMQYNNQ